MFRTLSNFLTKTPMHKNSWGLILGTFIGGFHLIWAVLVATGLAQPLLDFIYFLHLLNNPFVVQSFDALTALELVAFTFVVGYIIGWIIAFLWEKMHSKK